MPSKNMLPKGKRRHSVRAEYRKVRTEIEEARARERDLLNGDVPERETEEKEELWDTAELMREMLPDPSNPYLRVANAAGTRNEEQTPAERRYEGLKPLEHETPQIQVLDDLEAIGGVRSFTVEANARGLRVDAFLAKALPEISRARVQMLIDNGQVTVNGVAEKASHKLRGGECIEIEGTPQPAPLRAEPEDIPLDIVYEDNDFAVIDKPAGMTVHAGAGSLEDNRGTLVNALLFHFGQELSGLDAYKETQSEEPIRPGIVHRLDKQTSGLIMVAKNDTAHRALAGAFAMRALRKVYIALVHGKVKGEQGTVDLPISRDLVRRTRMTTRRPGGRLAITHWRVLERIDSQYGKFTLLEVHIETGRTHQIRVHMQALGHPVVGDPLYGAPQRIGPGSSEPLTLERNFLHAAELDLTHPITGKPLQLRAPLPAELVELLDQLR